MNSPTESLTFWRNWFDGVDAFPDELRLAWYDAVLRFAFLGVEPDRPTADDPLSAIRWNAVQMVRSTITISRRRKEIGALGGSKRQANAKQTASKRQANGKQTASKRQANANQEQVQGQEQEQEQYAISISATARGKRQPPTIDQFVDGGKLAGVPEDFARGFYADLVAAGWQDADGLYVANWRRYLKSAWREEQKKFPGARGSQPAGGIALDDIPDVR